MSVRLNITMDDDVYARLKKEVPPKKLSAFIAGAVRAKLHPDAKALNAAYQEASKERWRKSFDEDWKHIDDEGWPKGDGYHGAGMYTGWRWTRRSGQRFRKLDRL